MVKYRCVVCGREFDRRMQLVGHMSVHARKKKKKDVKEKEEKVEVRLGEARTLRELCNTCYWYTNGMCVVPMPIPDGWSEEHDSGKCSLYGVRKE